MTVGYTYKKEGAAAVNSDIKQDEFSAAYALSPTLSISANYTKADKQGTGIVDAKAKTLGIGYSLGPVAIVANYSKLENYTGTSGADADVIYLAARTSF